jgi:hypothetical protein
MSNQIHCKQRCDWLQRKDSLNTINHQTNGRQGAATPGARIGDPIMTNHITPPFSERKGIIDAGDCMRLALEQTSLPLVEGWLEREAFSVWYGPPNSGKTFVLLDLCDRLAAGEAWFGKTAAKGASLYLALEGVHGIASRVAAITKAHNRNAPAIRICSNPIDFFTLNGCGEIFSLVEATQTRFGLPVQLIVIDTVARALKGRDENSSSDMGALVAAIDTIRSNTVAHVAVIHHTGKDVNKGARGSNALLGAVDSEILVAAGEIKATKQRNLPAAQSIAFTLKPVAIGRGADGKPITSCVVAAA